MHHNKRTIRFQLITLFVASIVLPLLLTSYSLTFYLNQRILTENKKLLSNTTQSISQNISVYFDSLRRFSLSYLSYDDIGQFYNNVNKKTDIDETTEEFQDQALNYSLAIQKIFASMGNNIKGISFIPRNSPRDICYLVSQYSELKNIAYNTSLENDLWIQKAIIHPGSEVFMNFAQVNYYQDQSEKVFSLVRGVSNTFSGKIIGAVRVDASAEYLENMFQTLEVGENSGILLLDDKNQVIYSTNPSLNMYADQFLPGKGTLSDEREKYTVFSSPVSNFNWHVVYLYAQSEVHRQTFPVLLTTFLFGLIAIAAAFLIFSIRSHYITHPVRGIMDAMKLIEQGQLQARIPLSEKGTSEFLAISRQFNHMVDRLNEYICREYQFKLSQKNAEYLALQMQINPHFLYNMLNGFITLNRLGERQLLERAILQLSGMFRYVCSNAHETSTGQEFDFLEKYLSLQKLRFDERLNFHLYCSSEAAEQKIPKLLLQPLVENAIIHGMEPSDRGIDVEVFADIVHCALEDFLFMMVKDDGLGFDTLLLPSQKCIGLKNIRERLEFFHPLSFFQIRSVPGIGTVCAIMIPVCSGREGELE